jgi:hypothetical protein
LLCFNPKGMRKSMAACHKSSAYPHLIIDCIMTVSWEFCLECSFRVFLLTSSFFFSSSYVRILTRRKIVPVPVFLTENRIFNCKLYFRPKFNRIFNRNSIAISTENRLFNSKSYFQQKIVFFSTENIFLNRKSYLQRKVRFSKENRTFSRNICSIMMF